MLLEKIKYDADESYQIHEKIIGKPRLSEAKKLSDYILIIYIQTDLYGIYYPDYKSLAIVYTYIKNLYISYYNYHVVKQKLEIIITEEVLQDFMKNGHQFESYIHKYMLDVNLNVPFDTYTECVFQKSISLKKYSRYYTTDLYDVHMYLAYLLEYAISKYCGSLSV